MINSSDADVVNLHWVQAEMLSIADISRIAKPLVWTLHDMWAFSGAEHCAWDNRWRDGYRRNNRPKHERGFDLNRWAWQRKRKYWRRPMQIVCPSQWLADCGRQRTYGVGCLSYLIRLILTTGSLSISHLHGSYWVYPSSFYCF